jgi:hypothetical protein
VSWSAPPDGGSPIIQYTVESTPGGHTTVVGGQTLFGTVTGLTDGNAYTFTVAATNGVGTGDASGPSTAVTPQGPPGPPAGVGAVAGDAEAVVSWSPPLSDDGSPVTQYLAVSDPAGLTNETAYTFTVTATNLLGTGEPSAPSESATPRGRPGPPLAVVALPGDGQARVS